MENLGSENTSAKLKIHYMLFKQRILDTYVQSNEDEEIG